MVTLLFQQVLLLFCKDMNMSVFRYFYVNIKELLLYEAFIS